jgi:hypothetical protein
MMIPAISVASLGMNASERAQFNTNPKRRSPKKTSGAGIAITWSTSAFMFQTLVHLRHLQVYLNASLDGYFVEPLGEPVVILDLN